MKLERFLVKAKVSADACKELTYREGDFTYRDRYSGWNPFVGEEVVWHGGEYTWAMNYYGVVHDEGVTAGEVYAFLQLAMGQVKEDRPFRGPRSLKEGDYEYWTKARAVLTNSQASKESSIGDVRSIDCTITAAESKPDDRRAGRGQCVEASPA